MSESLRGQSVVSRSGFAVSTVELDGEAVVLDHGDRLHLLNATATVLWSRVDGVRTLDEIAEALASEFDEPVAEVCEQIVTLTRAWLELGLVEVNRR